MRIAERGRRGGRQEPAGYGAPFCTTGAHQLNLLARFLIAKRGGGLQTRKIALSRKWGIPAAPYALEYRTVPKENPRSYEFPFK